MGIGFVPIRKPGKLPVETIGVDYKLEYGTDRLEVDAGAIGAGQHVVMVDDLIATGGTVLAACSLIKQLGGEVIEAAALIDLPDLQGSARIQDAGVPVHALMAYEGL